MHVHIYKWSHVINNLCSSGEPESGVASTGNVRRTALRADSLLRLNLCVGFKAFALSRPGFLFKAILCNDAFILTERPSAALSCCLFSQKKTDAKGERRKGFQIRITADSGSNPFHTFTLWRRVLRARVESGKEGGGCGCHVHTGGAVTNASIEVEMKSNKMLIMWCYHSLILYLRTEWAIRVIASADDNS